MIHIIEETKKRYKRLSRYLAENCPEGIECHALQGDYSKLQHEILQLCGDKGFAFFFIDPLGWTDVGIQKLEKLLKRPKSEFLITFMYDFFNRFKNKADLKVQVEDILGKLNDVDYEDISRLQPKETEDFVVRKYRDQLKTAMGPDGDFPSRSYHAIVKDKDKERTKYHLVYVTRHHKGIVKFAEASEKAEFFQQVVRLQARQNNTGQFSLFTADVEARQMDGARIDLEDVKRYWLTKLSDIPIRFDEARLAGMLEETGWLIKDFQLAFGQLLLEKKVENLNAARQRKTRFVHFHKNERLRRCHDHHQQD